MDIRAISKAIAGAAAGTIGSLATATIIIPPEVIMPWYGYVVVGLLNAAFGFAAVYLAPRNKAS